MKSLQERIAWYETNFPDMAEQGVIRFHDSNVPEDDEVARQNFQSDLKNINRNFVDMNPQSQENRKRLENGELYISDIYLSSKSVFQAGLTSKFNFTASPNYDENIESDFVFFHELAHKIHETQDSILENDNWYLGIHDPDILSDTITNKNDKPFEKATKLYLYGECLADAFATLMTIRDHGINNSIGFVNLVSDYRILKTADDMHHMTSLTIDDCIQEVLGNSQLSFSFDLSVDNLRGFPPKDIFKLAQLIANKNPMLAELKQSGQSLKEKSNEVNSELLFEQKPLKEIQSLSTRLKGRFHQAVHRRISMRKSLGDNATHKEKIYDGPWADANAKYLYSKEIRATEQDLDQDEFNKYAQSIRMIGIYLFRLEAKNEVKDKTNENILKKLRQKLGRDDYETITASIDHFMETKHNDNRRNTAIDLMKNATQHTKELLGSYIKTNNNRLARMNGRRKPKEKKL